MPHEAVEPEDPAEFGVVLSEEAEEVLRLWITQISNVAEIDEFCETSHSIEHILARLFLKCIKLS